MDLYFTQVTIDFLCKAPEAIVIMATLLRLCSKRMINTVQLLPGMLI